MSVISSTDLYLYSNKPNTPFHNGQWSVFNSWSTYSYKPSCSFYDLKTSDFGRTLIIVTDSLDTPNIQYFSQFTIFNISHNSKYPVFVTISSVNCSVAAPKGFQVRDQPTKQLLLKKKRNKKWFQLTDQTIPPENEEKWKLIPIDWPNNSSWKVEEIKKWFQLTDQTAPPEKEKK